MVGFVTRGAVLKKMEQRELAIAEDKGAVVGCVAFHVRRDRVAVIYEIATTKAAAGRGVGTALLDWMKKALARRALAIKLKCTTDNTGANKFYERSGFRHCGEERGKKRSLAVWRLDLGGGFSR